MAEQPSTGEPGRDEQAAALIAAERERFAKELDWCLTERPGFWLGLVFVSDARGGADVQRLGHEVAVHCGVEFDMSPASDVGEAVLAAGQLVDGGPASKPTWVDWSSIGSDDAAHDAVESALSTLFDSSKKLAAAHPAGLLIVAPLWAEQAWTSAAADRIWREPAEDLWRDRKLVARFRDPAVRATQGAGKPSWMENAPERIVGAYREQGPEAAFGEAMQSLEQSANDTDEDQRQLLTTAAWIASEANRRGEAFTLARRALELATAATWDDSVTLLRATARATYEGELQEWGAEIADPPDRPAGRQPGPVYEARELAVFERAMRDRARMLGGNHRDVLEMRYSLGRGYERANDLEIAIAVYKDALARAEHSLKPEHRLSGEIRLSLTSARAEAEERGVIVERSQGVAVEAPGPAAAEAGASPTLSELADLARSGASAELQREGLASFLRNRRVSPTSIELQIEHTLEGIVLRGPTPNGTVSRIGGSGLLPIGAPWPRSAAGWPLSLVAAIDFAEMPALPPLPEAGLLLLYWDFQTEIGPDWVADCQAFYLPPGAPLQHPEQPDDANDPFTAIPVAGFRMPIAFHIENAYSVISDEKDLRRLGEAMSEVDFELYGHQLLGASRDIQGPVLEELPYNLQGASAAVRDRFTPEERAGRGWILLAQIESEDDMMFGDGGALYYLIPEADLVERRFDRVLAIMQCH